MPSADTALFQFVSNNYKITTKLIQLEIPQNSFIFMVDPVKIWSELTKS